MNDAGEFHYARHLVFHALREIGTRHELPKVAQDLTTYTRKNLDQFLSDTTEMNNAYCACFSMSSDDLKQWETYGELGQGFAIGFNIHSLLTMQIPAVRRGDPFIFCAPVIYNESDQRNLVWRFVKAGIYDLKTFAATRSQKPEDLTALRDRVTREIVTHLLSLIDFIKHSSYSSEREIRLFVDSNDGTLSVSHIQYYERDNESIPFIFMDLRNLKTGRLPLAEIKVGPKSASFPMEKAFVEELLDELGYGSSYGVRPRITQSEIPMVGCLQL